MHHNLPCNSARLYPRQRRSPGPIIQPLPSPLGVVSVLAIFLGVGMMGTQALQAQTTTPSGLPSPLIPPPPQAPSPELLPPPEELFQLPVPTQPTPLPPIPFSGTLTVKRFEVVGSTLLSPETLAEITAPFTDRPLTATELVQVASAITQRYLDQGYITSGAFIPADQSFVSTGGTVRIQVLEGRLEEIQISGMENLTPDYVRSRLAVATPAPLNVNRLVEALQLLQLNPLIRGISADLAAGSQPGTSRLVVTVAEAETFGLSVQADNSRAPSIGSERRQVQLNQANFLGLGDSLSLGYTNTDGSNGLDVSYTLPINPYNGTLRLTYSLSSSQIIEPPFDFLQIQAASRSYELSVRQPIGQTPSQEFVLGLTAVRRESETQVLGFPFPLSAGSDDEGRTRVSALRFFQEFTQRNPQDVIALRSQFSLGLDVLNATVNPTPPDSRFLAWRGQAQYVRLLAPETLLLLRTDAQWADRALLPLEQFGLGGVETVRGYRQDSLLLDNGILASAEVRLPILRIPEVNGLLQLTPFLDFGTGWNNPGRDTPLTNTLMSAGLGLLWRQGNFLTARLDWGIPFIPIAKSGTTWQDNGLYFSIVFSSL